jgi:hypothetical protein
MFSTTLGTAVDPCPSNPYAYIPSIARGLSGVEMVSKLGSRARHVLEELIQIYDKSTFFRHFVWSAVLSLGFIVIGVFAVKVGALGHAMLSLFLAQYITTLMLIEGLYEDLKHSCSKQGGAE